MRRVLMVRTNLAVDVGLAGLLRQEPDLEVHSVTYKNQTTFLRDITRFQPNVILLNEDGPVSPAQLHKLLAGVLSRSSMRIVVINIRSSVIDVYDSHGRQQVVVTHINDLKACIRGNPHV